MKSVRTVDRMSLTQLTLRPLSPSLPLSALFHANKMKGFDIGCDMLILVVKGCLIELNVPEMFLSRVPTPPQRRDLIDIDTGRGSF